MTIPISYYNIVLHLRSIYAQFLNYAIPLFVIKFQMLQNSGMISLITQYLSFSGD
jgi:hypothetical protein